jgi:hypothetical protein
MPTVRGGEAVEKMVIEREGEARGGWDGNMGNRVEAEAPGEDVTVLLSVPVFVSASHCL